MHPNEGELQALIDGELHDGAESVLAHLEGCEKCKAKKETMRLALWKIEELLESLDQPAPSLSADDLIQIAQRRGIASTGISRGMLWAASIAGLVTAGIVVAAVVPGSPIHEVVKRIVGGTESTSPSQRTAESGVWSQEAGVALVPGSELEIVFETTQEEGSIELVMTDGDAARIEVRSDSVGFLVADGSILIDNRDARASYRISLPQDLPAALIRVGDRTLYQRIGAEVLRSEFQPDGDAQRITFSAIPD